jgi:hypothetical protein
MDVTRIGLAICLALAAMAGTARATPLPSTVAPARGVVAKPAPAVATPAVVEPAPLPLPPLTPPPPIPLDVDHAILKPGEFLWLPEIAPAGPLVIVVSIPEQQAYVYRNGVRIAVSTVSTGKKGHETPTGVFTILQKHKDHKSDLYNSAPMPYMQRLTWDGVALHAGKLPGYPASHGCVRLPMEFAKRLFELTTFGITVIVANDASTPSQVAHPGVFAPSLPAAAPAAGATAGSASAPGAGSASATTTAREPRLSWYEQYHWRPDLSPTGPLTIILSGADQRVLVMRNGIEIGRARFELHDGKRPLGTRAYVLLQGKRVEASQVVPTRVALNWLEIDLPGYGNGRHKADTVLDADLAQRVTLPAKFATAVYDALGAGTTLLVTDAAVLPRTTGAALTVLTAGVPADEEAPPTE